QRAGQAAAEVVLQPGPVGKVGQEHRLAVFGGERLGARRVQLPQQSGDGLLALRREAEAEGPQPRMSFTLPRNERSFSCSSGEGRERASCSTSLRCSAVSLVGTTTRTVTCRSPRPRPPRWATPWPRTRNVVPLCVPSGMDTLALPPSAVGTSIDAPSAA